MLYKEELNMTMQNILEEYNKKQVIIEYLSIKQWYFKIYILLGIPTILKEISIKIFSQFSSKILSDISNKISVYIRII